MVPDIITIIKYMAYCYSLKVRIIFWQMPPISVIDNLSENARAQLNNLVPSNYFITINFVNSRSFVIMYTHKYTNVVINLRKYIEK